MAEAEGDSAPPRETAPDAESAPAPVPAAAGPGFVLRALDWLKAWHPFIFMAVAGGLAVTAWRVYPETAPQEAPAAEIFYHDGLDRLYRIINPDLPLAAPTPGEEALAARNAFMNLFVFHREDLPNHPEFLNPHLLFAEANRILADASPAMADKYRSDAAAAYVDADLWEKAPRPAAAAAAYASANFLDGAPPAASGGPEAFLEENADTLRLRRERRDEYVKYRLAEADVALKRPELARSAFEEIRAGADARRREEARRVLENEPPRASLPPGAFELGPEEFSRLDFLLAKAYDALDSAEQAKSLYLRYTAAVASGDSHAYALERLAALFREDGDVYRRVNPAQASSLYDMAAKYYEALIASPAASRERRTAAALGLAEVNSRLAGISPAANETGVDLLSRAGRTVQAWLEDFSGQPLPDRTLEIPLAAGNLLTKADLLAPDENAIPAAMVGSLAAMAGGAMETPLARRRAFLSRALENYDRAAANLPEGRERDRVLVLAARESWRLGRKRETEERFADMLDPLSSRELVLAARLGLALAALDRGDLRRAGMLILGGRAHPSPMFLAAADADWRTLAARLGNPAVRAAPGVWRAIWDALPEEGRLIALYTASGRRLDDDYVGRFVRAMNAALRRDDFYRPEDFPAGERNPDLALLLSRPLEALNRDEVIWRNRLLLEEAFPYDLARKAGSGAIGFDPFPAGADLPPGGLTSADEVREALISLAGRWAEPPPVPSPEEAARRLEESARAYRAALDLYGGDPGEILHELARNREALAGIRSGQGRDREALALIAEAGRRHLGVSLRAQGSPREMESLLEAGDAFFRAGLLERTIESQERFMDRFGYSALPGSEAAMAISRAENLLGRAYWFLDDADRAVESFRRNLRRRTPERFKSIYYIGRILMDGGLSGGDPTLLGSDAEPLPELDRDGDPVIRSALQAFNHLRQSPGLNPSARAWRWSTFDLAKLRHAFAEEARRRAADAAAAQVQDGDPPGQAWLELYDQARERLVEALERYPLARDGASGLSARVEPEDFADVMAARFETEYLLAKTLLILAEGRGDESLSALARAHLENLRDDRRYAAALFDPALDRFQLNAAIVREELGERGAPLERSRLGDDEGPMHSPERFRAYLRNSMFTLAEECFRAGDQAAARRGGEEEDRAGGDAAGLYRQAYAVYQDIYDRFGGEFGSQAMVGMGDAMSRLGRRDDAANHYRMAVNLASLYPGSGDGVSPGPEFWGGVAGARLGDLAGGYRVP